MNEAETRIFQKIFSFYEKWRNTVIETDEQWNRFADEVGLLGKDPDVNGSPLGWNLLTAVLDTFNTLYKNGMKPMPAGYFGRDDLST